MKDYNEFPPQKYLLRVLKNCPKSAHLYTQLWEKGRLSPVQAEKKDVRKEYLISPTMFRNLLAPLMCLNLIRFIENEEGRFQIDILGSSQSD